jgi:diaminopimelate decarboxylase
LTSIVSVKGGERSNSATGPSQHGRKEQLPPSGDAKVGYVVDAGINLLYTAAWYQFEVRPARSIVAPPVASRLYGPLCMAIDVIRDNVELPPLELGDVLSLHPVGAYNFVQSMQFISYRPAVVLIGEDGVAEIIRARETLADVTGPEQLPARLRAA